MLRRRTLEMEIFQRCEGREIHNDNKGMSNAPANMPNMPNIQTRVLLLTLGTTPQVVTESLYALATRPEPFVPDVIHIVTTGIGSRNAQPELLGQGDQTGHIAKLCAELQIREPKVEIRVIESETGELLDDIRNVAHQELAANQILDLVRQLTIDDATQVHVSLAGGRKTMGFYLAYALSLFGRPQDELSHVLVNAPFESLRVFFYPPKKPVILQLGEEKTASTADAEITLAPIPYVRLRGLLPASLIEGEHDYRTLVRRTQTRISGTLHLYLSQRRVDFAGESFVMTDTLFAWLYAFCDRAQQNQPGVDVSEKLQPEVMRIAHQMEGSLLEGSRLGKMHKVFHPNGLVHSGALSTLVSRINTVLKKHFGPLTPAQIRLAREPNSSRYALTLPADSIQLHR